MKSHFKFNNYIALLIALLLIILGFVLGFIHRQNEINEKQAQEKTPVALISTITSTNSLSYG
jgi:Tfp pilus assembly protein PilO